MKNDIEEEIKKLLRLVETHSSLPYSVLPEKLRLLRDAIFIIHPQLEADLETLIISALVYPFSKSITLKQYERMVPFAENLYEGMTFNKKLSLANALEILPDSLYVEIKNSNKVRNFFAHPNRNTREIKSLKNSQQYKKVLVSLLEARDGLTKLLEEKDLQLVDSI